MKSISNVPSSLSRSPEFSARRPLSSKANAASANFVEILESRIAPATLVSPTTLSFTDKSGNAVTVVLSKSLLTAANVNSVFVFDTGSVTGDNTTDQQLETLNLHALGQAAKGTDITITATPVDSSPGIASVGFIDAHLIDLGNVTINGDLGRIQAGDLAFATPGLKSLTVSSMGAHGLDTQAAGGNLTSLLAGGVGSITINGDATNVAIGVGGKSHGTIGSLVITGSLTGGPHNYDGSVRTQGNIDSVQVGSIAGGAGLDSGVIGTAGQIGSVVVAGSVTGSDGKFSGSILSKRGMTSVEIDGQLVGGAGDDSGQVGTAGSLGTVVVDDAVIGGTGKLSGTILASKNITSVTIGNALLGGGGESSGQVGAGLDIQSVTVGGGVVKSTITGLNKLETVSEQGIYAGSGNLSGTVVSRTIGSVQVNGYIVGYAAERGDLTTLASLTDSAPPFGGAVLARGTISSVTVTDGMFAGTISTQGSIGTVEVDGTVTEFSVIHAGQDITSVSINAPVSRGIRPLLESNVSGLVNSQILADNGSIGSVTLGAGGTYNSAMDNSTIAAGRDIRSFTAQAEGYGIESSQVVAGGAIGNVNVHVQEGIAIDNSTFHAGKSIGNITGNSTGDGEAIDGIVYGILDSTFQAAGGAIGNITAATGDSTAGGAAGIAGSGFNAQGSIGAIQSTGTISNSLFVAGLRLNSGFSTVNAGAFDNSAATGFGFGTGSVHGKSAAQIGAITVSEVGESGEPAGVATSTFLAGVQSAGADGHFGTKDDVVTAGSSIGDVSADTLQTVFVESGGIGTTTTAGEIAQTNYIATDAHGSGIGNIHVTVGTETSVILRPAATSPGIGATGGIDSSNFISNADIGTIRVGVFGNFNTTGQAGISGSSFLAGQTMGAINVNVELGSYTGSAYGIVNSTFKAGVGGTGGIGAITSNFSVGDGDQSSAAIASSTFDASAGAGRSGGIASVLAGNFDASNATAFSSSVFRAHGDIGDITATTASDNNTGVFGTVFSAYGSLGNLSVTGAVRPADGTPTRFLAGYDIGSDLAFGNEDLGAHSTALQGGQHVGSVNVTGDFYGSDIIASVNPGAGYIFGDSEQNSATSNDSHVGVGGTIGSINLASDFDLDGSPFGSDQTTSNGIEAKTFLNSDSNPVTTFSMGGFTGNIPSVILSEGGSVRVTNLTFPT